MLSNIREFFGDYIFTFFDDLFLIQSDFFFNSKRYLKDLKRKSK